MPTRPQLDEIDILGGSEFHQGGPYEALSPQRNKNRNRASSDAPVAAFNPDGPNSNPAITNPQEEREFKMQPHLEISDDLTDDQPVAGPDSAGLGPTTYMENAPASQQAIREQQQQSRLKPAPLAGSEDGLLERVRSFGRSRSGTASSSHGGDNEGLLGRVRSLRSNRSRSNSAANEAVAAANQEEQITVGASGHSTIYGNGNQEALHHRSVKQ